MNDNGGFDLGFEVDPLMLAASEFLDVAQQVGEVQSIADRTARSTLAGTNEKLKPIIQRAIGAVDSELRAIQSEVRPVLASVPAQQPAGLVAPGAVGRVNDRPPAVPEPLPPGAMPPVAAPGGRAWVVMTRESCGPDGFSVRATLVLDYVGGAPVNPPPDYRVGPVFNDRIQADNWARQWVEANPRTPCGIPPTPPTPPVTPTPPPSFCPPPSCVPTCPTPEPEPRKFEYCVWFRREPLDCVVLSVDQKEPPDKDYKRISCHYTKEEADEAARAHCELQAKADQLAAGYTTPTSQYSFCNSDLWSKAEVLAGLSRVAAQYSGSVVREVPPSDIADIGAQNLLGWLASLSGLSNGAGLAADALQGFGNALLVPGKQLALGTGCDSPAYVDIAVTNMVLSVLQKWIGSLPPAVTANLQYSEAFLCPWLLPSAGETQALFQAGLIDEETATNLGRLNGRCNDTTIALLAAGQTRFTAVESVDAYWRGIISRDDARSTIRANGYLDPAALEQFEGLRKFVPTPQDLVRFLVRDVFDESDIVPRFRLDDEFTTKFPESGPGNDFARAYGVERDVLRYYWRAHWEIPSPTQLSEFWKRLRPGDPVDPARADRIGLSGIIPKWSPRSDVTLQVTSDDIDAALAQQDILPFWRERFRAVQFLPLTRVDARRAYDIGVLGVDDIFESLIQGGYREPDALVLTEFAYKEKNLGIRNSEPAKIFLSMLASEDETRIELTDLGFSSDAIDRFIARETRGKMRAARSIPEFTEFVSGNLDEPELRDALTERFFSVSQIDELVASAKRLAKSRFRGACTEAAKTRFIWGELGVDEAKRELRGFGWSAFAADEIVNGWNCELSVSDRLPTVRQLLAWADLGVIGVADFRARMRRLRFPDDDIDRFLAQAAEQKRIEIGKEAEKAIKERQKQIEKERQAADRAAAKAAAASAKAVKGVRTARTAAEALALAVSAAAVKWATFTGLPFEAASDTLRQLTDALVATGQFNPATAVKIVVRATEWSIANEETNLGLVVEILASETDTTADAIQSSL